MSSDRTLLAEIERDLLDGKPLADLLRKCIMLGGRSGSQPLREWANHELRGYKGDDDIPKYRVTAAAIMMDAVTGNARVTGQIVAETSLPKFAREAGLGNAVELRQGVGELEAMVAAQDGDKGIKLVFPGGDVIGRYFDENSGNPFQHIHSMYWSLLPSAMHGVLDHVRTTLTEFVAELENVMPNDQDDPTAEQASHALQVAVHGGSPQFNIAAPSTSITASGSASVAGVTGGQTGAAGRDVQQAATYNLGMKSAVVEWLDEYRALVPQFDEGLRPIIESQLQLATAEIERPAPREKVVRGLLGSLKEFAQSAIASMGAGAGTIALTELVTHWPLH